MISLISMDYLMFNLNFIFVLVLLLVTLSIILNKCKILVKTVYLPSFYIFTSRKKTFNRGCIKFTSAVVRPRLIQPR